MKTINVHPRTATLRFLACLFMAAGAQSIGATTQQTAATKATDTVDTTAPVMKACAENGKARGVFNDLGDGLIRTKFIFNRETGVIDFLTIEKTDDDDACDAPSEGAQTLADRREAIDGVTLEPNDCGIELSATRDDVDQTLQ